MKRQESSVLNPNISPLAKNPLPHSPIAPNTKPDNPSAHFCSSPLNTMALTSEEFQFEEEKLSIPNSIFSMHSGQNLFRGCAGEEVREGKTDSGMKQKVRGNWISSTLHTTRSHTRLTGAYAKDAQTLAKVFFFKGQSSDCYLSASLCHPQT